MEHNVRSGTKAALKFICPRVGLVSMVSLYALGGGFLFSHLESENELSDCTENSESYLTFENETIQSIWNTMSNYKPSEEKDTIQNFQDMLFQLNKQIYETSFDGKNCSLLGKENGASSQWSLVNAVLFSTTVFTTVGYGNIAPKTKFGRLVCLAYALLGIPLMLLTLANFGEIMANIFRYAYLNVCCCSLVRWYKRSTLPTSYSNLNDAKKTAPKNEENFDEILIEDEDDEELDKISVPVVVTLFLIVTYVLFGAILFSVWMSDLDWMGAAYFSFITLSTIGFGDIVPSSDNMDDVYARFKLMGTALYMVLGMAVLSMAFNLLQEEVIDKIHKVENKVISLKDRNNLLEMKNK
ncbi:hypothetical protein HELRODRAFT_161572 [Helobdella robusta]|uniref:Potassium channel domain-containing protein n=1 Tax=Helobdella robusta TaxID=6412 RepID=T1ERM7_HELRO|nr:hypothetical protein HELRODRAFT_161572 [Helobdella robusta]ESO02317.1 hypothetical protein HELRODRAFT_161572 [Helobdella robusta]